MSENYWASEEGIMNRIDLLAEDVRMGTFNNATKVYGTAVGATHFKISENLIPTSCSWCRLHVGRTYRLGMFMPHLPKHPHCIHYFIPLRIGAPPNMLSWLFS